MTFDPYREWLIRALEKTGTSQSALARQMTKHGVPMTPDKLNKSISGARRLQTGEALLAAECLGIPAPTALVPIVGRVGADSEGRVLYGESDSTPDRVPIPPAGSLRSVAVEVAGESMTGIAENGGLIYYEDIQDPPTDDMLGEIVVVGTPDGEVMIKRLLRSPDAGTYDLQSANGHIRQNVPVAWAAHITAIIPPRQARRIRQSFAA